MWNIPWFKLLNLARRGLTGEPRLASLFSASLFLASPAEGGWEEGLFGEGGGISYALVVGNVATLPRKDRPTFLFLVILSSLFRKLLEY